MAQWKQLFLHRNISKHFALRTNVTNAVIKLFACLHLVLVLCCLVVYLYVVLASFTRKQVITIKQINTSKHT